ncbi:MAG TPA: 50S ribosomal protein L29 [Candidatus Peribacterales bacterium]|nr:50S ribosomal protein L29 [Candidatus Peribacterales bacterium]
MTKVLTMPELLKMQKADLQKEIGEQRHTIATLEHSIRAGVEKGTHKLREAKHQLARMFTVLSFLQRDASALTMPAPVIVPPKRAA